MAENFNKCENCPIRKTMEKFFPTITTKDYDTTCWDHACGCKEYFLYDDTPGFREKDEWVNAKNCILEQARKFTNEELLPTYKGTYEDLFKY